MSTPVRRRIAWWAAGSLAALAVFAGLHAWTPPSGAEYSICLWRRAFHLACPGCGMTRAFAALAKGDWAAAWTFHPLAPALLAQVAVFWLLVLRRGLRAAPEPWPAVPSNIVIGNLVALVLVWVVRLGTGTLPS